MRELCKVTLILIQKKHQIVLMLTTDAAYGLWRKSKGVPNAPKFLGRQPRGNPITCRDSFPRHKWVSAWSRPLMDWAKHSFIWKTCPRCYWAATALWPNTWNEMFQTSRDVPNVIRLEDIFCWMNREKAEIEHSTSFSNTLETPFRASLNLSINWKRFHSPMRI